jgi:hypothetical protein
MDPDILDDNGEVVEENEWKCEVCGSAEEFMTIEWSDSDYWQDGKPEVPLEPMKYDNVKGFGPIGVYDISALRARCLKDDKCHECSVPGHDICPGFVEGCSCCADTARQMLGE